MDSGSPYLASVCLSDCFSKPFDLTVARTGDKSNVRLDAYPGKLGTYGTETSACEHRRERSFYSK